MVLQRMEVFDETVTAPRRGADQGLDLGARDGLGAASAEATLAGLGARLHAARRPGTATRISPVPPWAMSPHQRSLHLNSSRARASRRSMPPR